ncbi:MAG: metal ABC transporter ATP-binding protein [Polyangiaceae bacterium]|nr:metal ABC transporter ATP-binding protein [Polyangiaceae bacterium]
MSGAAATSATAGAARPGELLLRCRSLVVGYRGEGLLPPLDLELRRGTLVGVLGRNGSGKSTWFKTLLGLLRPVAGRVERSAPGLRMAYVPQSAGLDAILPLSARDVVAQGRLTGTSFLRPWASAEDRRVVAGALEAVGVAGLARRRFRDLSKGQQQRVLFARMLATRADLALLDEPTAAMDVEGEREAVAELARLAHGERMAVVLVTHALELAERNCDELIVFDRPARRVVHGPSAEVAGGALYRRLRGELA